jgi:vacuolar-type H+-ATPase subunit F/Vma7
MTGIALVADRNTATCFKLAGLSNVHKVEDAKGAEKCLQTLLEKGNLRIVLVSERLLNQVQIFDEIAARKYPLIIPIPDIKGPSALKTDLMVELIKRKTGIEVKF